MVAFYRGFQRAGHHAPRTSQSRSPATGGKPVYSREDIRKGAEELGVPLDDHISFCIEAMKERVRELGLAGN